MIIALTCVVFRLKAPLKFLGFNGNRTLVGAIELNLERNTFSYLGPM
jgi:hypothetical protein